jgi:prephenate dehydratase
VPITGSTTISFLGPPASFSEAALRSEADLARATLIPLPTFVEVTEAVETGEVDLGFVAIENSIEGTVNVALDQLVFTRELWIVREVQLPITQCLLGRPGTTLAQIKRVASIPVATAQCRLWLAANLGPHQEEPATSTSEAARRVAEEDDPAVAAIGNRLGAERYGLEILADGIEDHDTNMTRFALVARPAWGLPEPTGHDKTSIVCFQSADHPGSLHTILGQFAARNLNLTKLESRPTKQALGDYCFVIDLDGHVADEIVADCLRDLHATLPAIKFLGSYPAAGHGADERRRQASEAWEAADRWIAQIRGRTTG